MITLTKLSQRPSSGDIAIAQSRVADWQQSGADRDGVSLAAYVHAIFGLLA
jgi:hypothetical protein